MGVRLSLIIPAYNESTRIQPGLAVVANYLNAQPYRSELLIVDDGSRDDTADICRAAIATLPQARVISYRPNRGKGYAVRAGVLAAQGEWVAFLDADMSTLPDEIDNAWRVAEATGADMVIGSRSHPAAEITPTRALVSAAFYRHFYPHALRVGWATPVSRHPMRL
jgi:dolichyl-phosphate beta-glucosyltransferase